MKLYDIVAADGEFVESLTQREIMNKFGLTKCRFRTFLDNSYLIDALTENIRRAVGWGS